MSFDLTETTAAPYLVRLGLIPEGKAASAAALGGGVSNTLVKVSAGGSCFVLKQSLARLRVAEPWFADRERVHREWAALAALAPVLPPGQLPRPIHHDPDNFLFVMSCAPADGRNWKDELLAGRLDPAVACKVGALLGKIHRATRGDAACRQQFIDDRPFIQLRIDPYHRSAAQRNPDVAAIVEREAQRMLAVKTALAHGDYSPKNIIVAGGQPFLLDFEVVHYGNPVFDLAFLANHLCLKAIHIPQWRDGYFECLTRFWQGYLAEAAVPASEAPDLERDATRQLGCLMLARIDGKSPVEYITRPEPKELARRVAKTLLLDDYVNLGQVTALLNDSLKSQTR